MDENTDETLARSHTLVESLVAAWPGARLTETHISWVVLTGEHAYKFKKPVDLGFLDFTTLEARRHYCTVEVALNRRFAPEIYLDVVTVSGTPEHPILDGDGAPIEYAVRMRRFDADDELAAELDAGTISERDMRQFASDLADIHAAAPVAGPDSEYATLGAVFDPIAACLDALDKDPPDAAFAQTVAGIAHWLEGQRDLLGDALVARARDGFVRECHGDLHVTNIVRHEGRLKAFDCIEFDEALRYIDTVNDIAFLVMDLDLRGHGTLANAFLDAWLERSGDFAGMRALPLYLAYRSLVRAKIALIGRAQAPSATTAQDCIDRARRHLDLAANYTERHGRPTLFLTHGLSGSGKSWFASRVCTRFGIFRLRSDVERKRLFDAAGAGRPDDAGDAGLYSPDRSDRTYARLLEQADMLLRQGFSVLVDAAFLDPSRRRPFIELANVRGAPLTILDTVAPPEVLEARLEARGARGDDPSDADVAVMHAQMAEYEPLGEREAEQALRIDTSVEEDVKQALARIRALEPAARLPFFDESDPALRCNRY